VLAHARGSDQTLRHELDHLPLDGSSRQEAHSEDVQITLPQDPASSAQHLVHPHPR
jgi:hypothetical protein